MGGCHTWPLDLKFCELKTTASMSGRGQGNAGGWPSTTGQPSGGGRSNAPPGGPSGRGQGNAGGWPSTTGKPSGGGRSNAPSGGGGSRKN